MSFKNKIAENFPHQSDGHIYLNHAAISPLSKNVRQAIDRFLIDRHTGAIDRFEQWSELIEDTRLKISNLIHAKSADNITFLGNTSEAVSAITEGLTWEKGDEIILNTLEFPTNVQPFRILGKKGVNLIFVKPDKDGIIQPDDIKEAITSKTKMVSISAVQYLTGLKSNLKAIGDICEDHGLLFVVDGIQGLGAVDIDVVESKIDALASGSHKWLMAPMGIGFLYISEKMKQLLTPFKTGWLSVEVPWDMRNFEQNWAPISSHLEVGTYNMIGITGLHASLSTFEEIGYKNAFSMIQEHTNYLYDKLSEIDGIDLLTPKNPHFRSGIVTFKVDGMNDCDQFVSNLTNQKITLSSREGFIRISPHYYNRREELDIVLTHFL
tara:strand:+ start:11219 stop:12358 length:1140 start_codon:yes stop_codon:yes gene_type:complete